MCFSGLPVCPDAAVCISSVLLTRETIQYVGGQHTLADCCGTAALAIPFSQKFQKEVIKLKIKISHSIIHSPCRKIPISIIHPPPCKIPSLLLLHLFCYRMMLRGWFFLLKQNIKIQEKPASFPPPLEIGRLLCRCLYDHGPCCVHDLVSFRFVRFILFRSFCSFCPQGFIPQGKLFVVPWGLFP